MSSPPDACAKRHLQPAHLEVQAEEGLVGEEAVAARRGYHVAAQRRRGRAAAAQHRGRPVHDLLHVAAHAVQRQIVCHLHPIRIEDLLFSCTAPSALHGPHKVACAYFWV